MCLESFNQSNSHFPQCGPPAGDALLWSRNQAALICSYHRQNMSLPSSPTQRFLIRLGSLPLQSSLKATVLTYPPQADSAGFCFTAHNLGSAPCPGHMLPCCPQSHTQGLLRSGELDREGRKEQVSELLAEVSRREVSREEGGLE